MSSITLLRVPALRAKTGKARTANLQDVQDGLLTRPIKIGARAVAWPEHEIDAIVRARVAGLSNAEIRALVQRLTQDRRKLLTEAQVPFGVTA